MNENTFQKNDEIELDLGRIFQAIVDKVWMVGIVTILCAVIVFGGTFFFITPSMKLPQSFMSTTVLSLWEMHP